MTSDNLQKIKNITEEFFKKMTITAEIKTGEPFGAPESSVVPIDLEMEEPRIFIGQNGQTLNEIQHLLKAILRKNIDEQFYIDLDINDYKKKKTTFLKDMARAVADEVALYKKERVLAPMSPYERRIVHLELAEREDISTESFGEREDRRVVIKPTS